MRKLNPIHNPIHNRPLIISPFSNPINQSISSIKFTSPSTLMTRNTLLESPAEATPRTRRRVGEVAGGTAADCAAVFCCCPCSLMNLLILAVYKVPRGICKKAWDKAKNKKRSKNQNKNKGLLPVGPARFSDDVSEKASDDEYFDNKTDDAESESAVFEKEMWDRFYGAGFWRTDSIKQT